MRKLTVAVIVLVLLFLLSPVLLRKRGVPLLCNGHAVAFAQRPWVMPWSDNEFNVYDGKSKLFSLWGDFFDFPLFIHPFADGKRFLCIDDDDTSVLVFVVDFSVSTRNESSRWPPNDYLRSYMAGRITNVVYNTTARVRLPEVAEVQEVSSNLETMPPDQFEASSFPSADFGLYRSYWSKEGLLSELATNRQSVWP
jgi:hypothetical protein